MSTQRQDKVQQIAEQMRAQAYCVDPGTVADALLARLRWDDVPDLAELTSPPAPRRWIPRVRFVIRVRRLSLVALRARPRLSA